MFGLHSVLQDGWNVWVIVGDNRPLRLELIPNHEGRGFSGISNIGLISDAHQEDAGAIDALAVSVKGLYDVVDDIRWPVKNDEVTTSVEVGSHSSGLASLFNVGSAGGIAGRERGREKDADMWMLISPAWSMKRECMLTVLAFHVR